MGGVKRKPRPGTGTTIDANAMVPSAVHVDHARNFSRAQLYPCPTELEPYFGAGTKICFTLAEIEARLASLKQHGQITACSIYLTTTGDAFLVAGYLRHAAFLLAEARGELDQIKTPGHRMKCMTVTEPKSVADWLALADHNVAENDDAKLRTPIDVAVSIERYMKPEVDGGFGLTEDQVAERTGHSKRNIARYLRLLKLPPDVIGKVHRGEVAMTAALKQSTATGQAGSPGPRSSFSVKRMRKAIELREATPPPTTVLTSGEQVLLMSLVAGEVVDIDKVPKSVSEWAAWLQPESAPREPKPRNKKPPRAVNPKANAEVEATE